MDELSVVLKARELINKVSPTTIPVPIETYVEHVGAVLRPRHDLEPDEPGWCFESNDKHYICVNAKDREERQRFTACHELAHIVLGLPSEHRELPWWSYAKRSPNEIFCDVFAAELLLPYKLLKPLVEKVDISLAAVDELAERFVASNMATGSRFAALVSAPCAFVLSEQGKVTRLGPPRYAKPMPGFRPGWPYLEVPCRSGSASAAPARGRKKWKPMSGSTIGIVAESFLRTPVTSSSGTKRWRCYGSRMKRCRHQSGNAAKNK